MFHRKEPRGAAPRNVRPWAAALVIAFALVFSACASRPAGPGEAPHPERAEAPHWSYAGDTGPEHWYALDEAFILAREGRAQSPIDIATPEAAAGSTAGKPVVHYRESRFKIENNGHTIEAVPTGADNYVVLDNESFVLEQFHFHAPSEHRFDGAPFAMELHLVHRDPRGKLAVLGLMITQGAANQTLQGVFDVMPQEPGEGEEPEAVLNLAELFTGTEGMYRYEGSLTTPPCSEGVAWVVFAQPLELSAPQIDAYRGLYQGNNRPVQNRYGRTVYLVK